MDGHACRGQVERGAAARSRVRTNSFNLLRGVRWRNLVNGAGERKDSGERGGFLRRICSAQYGTGRIVRIRLGTKSNGCVVDLRLGIDVGDETSAAPEKEDEKSGSKRVESARMANAPNAGSAASQRDDIVRGHVRRLVDEKHAFSRPTLRLRVACHL